MHAPGAPRAPRARRATGKSAQKVPLTIVVSSSECSSLLLIGAMSKRCPTSVQQVSNRSSKRFRLHRKPVKTSSEGMNELVAGPPNFLGLRRRRTLPLFVRVVGRHGHCGRALSARRCRAAQRALYAALVRCARTKNYCNAQKLCRSLTGGARPTGACRARAAPRATATLAQKCASEFQVRQRCACQTSQFVFTISEAN